MQAPIRQVTRHSLNLRLEHPGSRSQLHAISLEAGFNTALCSLERFGFMFHHVQEELMCCCWRSNVCLISKSKYRHTHACPAYKHVFETSEWKEHRASADCKFPRSATQQGAMFLLQTSVWDPPPCTHFPRKGGGGGAAQDTWTFDEGIGSC